MSQKVEDLLTHSGPFAAAGDYATVKEVKAAHRAAGGHYFDADAEAFFGTTTYRLSHDGRCLIHDVTPPGYDAPVWNVAVIREGARDFVSITGFRGPTPYPETLEAAQEIALLAGYLAP